MTTDLGGIALLSIKHVRRAAALSAVALGALAAPALADTYCVKDEACVAGGGHDHGTDIQGALTAAGSHDGDDTVQIGPGTFYGPFYYGSGQPVHVVGAGRGETVLRLSQVTGQRLLDVAGVASEVRDLTLEMAGGSGNTGLVLQNGSARRIVVEAWPGNDVATGILLGGSTLEDVDVSVPRGAADRNAAVHAAGERFEISDARLKAGIGLSGTLSGEASLVRRTRIDAVAGIIARCGRLTVEDTLVVNAPGDWAAGVAAATCDSSPAPTDVTVRHATVIGNGASNSVGVYAVGEHDNRSATLRLSNSIVTGAGYSLARGSLVPAHADLFASWSSWDPVREAEIPFDGSSGALVTDHLVPGDPMFADGFGLRPDSPLVDAGDPAALAAGESAIDLAGNPRIAARVAGGTPRRDLGAFELQPGAAPAGQAAAPPPAAQPPAAPPSIPTPPLGLMLSGKTRQKPGRAIAVTARSSDSAALAGTARLRIGTTRKTLGRATASAAPGVAVKLRFAVKKRRRHRIASALKAGRKVTVRIRIKATTADGRSATASRRVRIAAQPDITTRSTMSNPDPAHEG
jgi:hypothetical protein